MRRASVKDLFLSFFGPLQRMRVFGDSMNPLLEEGDTVFVRTSASYAAGDVVVAKHPFLPKHIVKRVQTVSQDGVFLVGATQESEDSRGFGEVPLNNIIGKVAAYSRT